MTNSWDDYYSHYSDWDDTHRFKVRLELKFEENLKNLGYIEFVESDDLFSSEISLSKTFFPQSKTYLKTKNEITISFDVPYDWSIDTDWEDKALILLGLRDEWVIDSSVEDK
tara:strand:+ start:400 stop:735 length:336 start_codon:yes stop_codon:yes gene_type:complete